MNRLRYASLILVFAAALLATGSGAFASVNADRPSSVAVASDDKAYLAIENEGPIELDNGVNSEQDGTPGAGGAGQSETEVTILRITNNFPSDIDVTASPAGDSTHGQPPKFAGGDALDVTEHGTEFEVTADIVCSPASGEEALTVSIEAHSDDGSLSVDTTEEVTVACTGEPPNGNAEQGSATESDDQD